MLQTTTPLADLAKVLKVFEHVQSVLCDMDSFYRIAREAVLTASAEVNRSPHHDWPPYVCFAMLPSLV